MTPQLHLVLDALPLILPEVVLVIGMCAILLLPFLNRKSVAIPAMTTLVTLAVALGATIFNMDGNTNSVLGDMLAIDPFSQFFKIILFIFTGLVVAQWLIVTRDATHPLDTPDMLCLLLGATFGMALMASANNLLMIFIATEAASFPSYALAGFRKRTKIGSESSLKYVIFGSASSAIMVYGMSLIYGLTGSLDLAEVAHRAVGDGFSPLMAVGLLALFAGIAFKLSAVPLHFWCPDVFQGAPIEVTTFLSVASKGAAICMLLRILMSFGIVTPDGDATTGIFGMGVGIGILGAITATWGNLVALRQTHFRRLLAYSSIGHAGYMIMGCSLVVLSSASTDPAAAAQSAAGAVLFYLLVYTFMNLGAFTIGAIIARHAGTEDIRDYTGMLRRSPILAVLLSVFLLSLFGMPGLGGFMGKIYLMGAMTEIGVGGYALIAVLLLNTLISLYFYMRPVFYMVLAKETAAETEARPSFVPQGAALAILALCTVMLLWTGILPNSAGNMTREFAIFHQSTDVSAIEADVTESVLPTQAAVSSLQPAE